MACYVYERSELNVAGMPGFEPRKSVLETDVIAVSPHPYASALYNSHILFANSLQPFIVSRYHLCILLTRRPSHEMILNIGMKKLLRKKDIFLLTLAGIGDIVEEIRDPLSLVSSAYENMYGFVPGQYRRHNFSLLVGKSYKTGYIEKVIKEGKAYLRLTNSGKKYLKREFPMTTLTKKWNKKWIIVIFDIEEVSRKQRDQLRNMLKNIGFGMLQQSVWITPLPIGQDIKESLAHQGFSNNAFVLEVSHLLLGNPKNLARRVWRLDELEEKFLSLSEEKEDLTESIQKFNGREKKGYIKLEENLREQRKRILEFLVTLPPLPREFFPDALQKAIST